MARPIFTVEERRIKNELFKNMQNRFGKISDNRDSTFSTFSETIGDELNLLRREVRNEFEEMQLSNAFGDRLDKIALDKYGLSRRPATYAEVLAEESNLYFYVENGTFGEINEDRNIIIPEGTEITVKENGFGNNVTYETVYEYILPADSKSIYVTARSTDTGYKENVDKKTLTFHNFLNYSKANQNLLKVSNRFAVLNGSDKESDALFKSRLNNFLASTVNFNEDLLTLKAIMVPGITEVRMIPNYYGIGSLGIIVFGSGRESNSSLISLMRRRVLEVVNPGTTIDVAGGITVYLDFDIRVYIKRGLSIIERSRIENRVKSSLYEIIENAEKTGVIRLTQVSNTINSIVPGDYIVGFGRKSNGSIFEKVYQRKSDRFNSLPEYREELVGNEIYLEDDERIAFGIVNVILEEGEQ